MEITDKKRKGEASSVFKRIKKAKSLPDFATAIRYTPKGLSYILYGIEEDKKYTEFEIPKSGSSSDSKSSKTRKIQAPCSELKKLQSRLARILAEEFENSRYPSKSKSLSHGYRKKHSIITNSFVHKNKRYVFNIDLKDFFPSINFGRVRGYFMTDTNFKLDQSVATIIAQIACHKNELPQGSPLSPIVSNLIGHMLDVKLVRLAKKAGCSYSRYVDDITFSTNKRDFPDLIAEQEDDEQLWIPSKALVEKIESAGFKINPSKVSMQYRTNRQMTTGLVVNEKVNIPADYYRRARVMCNHMFRTGHFLLPPKNQTDISKDEEPLHGTCRQLRGILSHIYNVKTWKLRKKPGEKTKKDSGAWQVPKCQKENSTGIHKLFCRFIYFEKFHNLERPIIICEGKTDIIHLKCAIEARCSNFLELCSTSTSDTEGKPDKKKMNIDFFKFSKLNQELICLKNGGTSNLTKFINTYDKMMRSFGTPGQSQPVIVLCDNDEAGKKVLNSTIRKHDLAKEEAEDIAGCYRVVRNLYLVIPQHPKEGEEKETAIEDYHQKDWLEKELDGKTLAPREVRNKDFDKAKHYDKTVFAEKIIKPNCANVNFEGFDPLLKSLEEAIKEGRKIK